MRRFVALVFALLLASSAQAESGIVVLSVGQSGPAERADDELERVVREIEVALAAGGSRVLAQAAARELFEQRVSRPRVAVSILENLLPLLAPYRTADGEKRLRQAMTLFTTYPELFAHYSFAEDLVRLLAAVMVEYAEHQQTEQAAELARWLVSWEAPYLLDVPMRKVARDLLRDARARVRYSSIKLTLTKPSPCHFFVDGEDVREWQGRTEFDLQVPESQSPHAFFIGCSGNWRVRMVRSGESLQVDPVLDVALAAGGPRIWLRYMPDEPRIFDEHARAILKALGIDQALVVERRADRIHLELVTEGGRRAVSMPAAYSGTELTDAVAAVMAAPSAAQASTRPSSSSSSGSGAVAEPAASPAQRRSPWMFWTGLAVAGVGAAGEVAAWTMYRQRVGLADDIRTKPNADPGQWSEKRAPMLAAGVSGAVMLGAGLDLLVMQAKPERFGWWLAGVSAAAGAGLVAWGAVDLAHGSRCNSANLATCVADETTRDRGALLVASGAPLLTLPLAKLFGGLWRSSGRETVQLSATGRGVVLRGGW